MTFFKRLHKAQEYSPVDFVRKVSFLAGKKLHIVVTFGRKLVFYFYTKCWIKHIGKRIQFLGVANNVSIGNDAAFYSNVILDIEENALLKIGNNFTLSYGSIIVCNKHVEIGNFVMIGEYTSIRDTSHSFKSKDTPFCKQQDYSSSIILGNNIWIGRGCMLFPGTIINDNVIVGANSVIKGHLEANSVYAGSPAKKIKSL
jgi:acetyltransferase-like isoleucine patch superfamily enzyme